MYKLIICAGVLLFAPPTITAQQIDDLIFESGRPGIDENVPDLPPVGHYLNMPDMLKTSPFVNRNNVSVSAILTPRKRGTILVKHGVVELVSAGFKKSSLHGIWRSRYYNGSLLDSGNFNNNIPDGEWRSWYKNGNLRSIRTYNAFKWNAIQSEIHRGNTRFYNYTLSKMLSFQPYRFLLETNASHSFNSLHVEEPKYHPPFQYCLHHGLYMNFYPNGAVKDSGYYHNGLRDGLWYEYHSNGTLGASGTYLYGAKHGGWKFLDLKGRLVMLEAYKNGKLVHCKAYNNHQH
jgi:antitoxin component YwqK of YwqJK toxin-antitoxin module